ncbi:outer membrane lipoprotein-sorting protein [Spirochaetia bacterium]|nr:outer membrane lipoprotein-sorting protein [Spirochaetia bacterium]
MRSLKTKVFCILSVLLALSTGLWGQSGDAAAIVDKSRNRIKADTISTRSRMVITAKNGSTTERVIDQYSKDDASGNARTMIVFQAPATVAGTRFLTMGNSGGAAGKANDQMIFMPSLGKVRRIAASEGSGSFMGTDLSYDDISSTSRSVDRDTHRILPEGSHNGNACYVIESTPVDSGFAYSKMIQYIDKNNFVAWKIELYNKRNVHVKTMETVELKDVQGRLTAMVIRMSSLQAGTFTTVNTEVIKYDDPVPEGVFTARYLETGRPQ